MNSTNNKHLDDKLREMFPNGWYELLEDYITSKKFVNLLTILIRAYSKTTIYPADTKNIFRVFKTMGPNDINCLVLGLDPYPGEATRDIKGNKLEKPIPYAIGLSFATHNEVKLPRSLEIIKSSYDYKYFTNDLQKWVDEGIFLLNSFLTVEKGKAKSHEKFWREFTSIILSKLSQENPNISYLLWGKDAQSFKNFIRRGHIVERIHPVASVYNRKLVFDPGFTEVNNYRIKNNQKSLQL